jgi:purine/pyrimidine-nucleoside phosphorylase
MINVNAYFQDTVKSLGYESSEGKSSVGVMEPGVYEFGTSTHETMVVIQGELLATLPGESSATSYKTGQQFEVPANVTFKVESVGQSSYLCKYK